MQLILLFTVSTLIVGSIDAAIVSGTQHITNDLDRQIRDLYKARDVKDGLNAAAEYFKAPQAYKQNLKIRTKGSLAAAVEYFKTPNAGELRSNALILAQERLAAAAEYLKAPEFPKRLSRTNVESARAAAAEYFKAPESQRHNTRRNRTAERLAAAAEYFRLPENYSKVNVAKTNHAAAKRPLFSQRNKIIRPHLYLV